MSKIKLTADSGGGSVTLKAPATTTSNADLEFTVPDVATGATILTSESSLTSSKLTGALPGPLSNRNILYNGAMQISQRAASTGVGASNGTTFATDRWGVYTQNTGSRYTISQDGESPDGFGYSLKIDCTTADTSLAANEEVNITQKIEGFDVQRMQKGTSGAKAYTLSFWAKSVKTGTYICRLLGRDNTTSNVSKAYTISDTNWNKYTINFPADTDSSRKDDNDNGEALRVVFWLVAGSGVNSGTLQETWAGSSDSGAATGQVNFADSTSNIFYLTGVQLEPGSTATEYEHRTYGDELARCQRYYYSHVGGSNTWGEGGSQPVICLFHMWNTGSAFGHIPFPVTMRTTPTADFNLGTDYVECESAGTTDFCDVITINSNQTHKNSARPYIYGDLSYTAGNAGLAYLNHNDAHVAFTSEL